MILFWCGLCDKGGVMPSMQLDRTTVQMYQESRGKVFIEALEQETSELQHYAVVEKVGNVKVHHVPVSGTREFGHRQDREEEISATENQYGWRCMRPIIMDDWAKLNTLDPHFLDNLPINLTNIAKMQGHAAGRAKDGILTGTCVCGDKSSPVYGEMIIRTSSTIQEDAVTNSPFKGGTTSGIFGTAYTGEFGDNPVDLELQPRVLGAANPLTKYSDYTVSSVLDLRRTGVIPVNYVESGSPALSGFTPSKLTAGLTAMRARKVKGQLALCVTPQQALNILNDEQMRNILYGHQVLKTGMPDSILGVKLLVTDHVPLVNVGGRWVRACPLWNIEDLVYGIWQDVRFEVRQPQHMKSTIYAGATLMMGATRRRDESFISILCDEGIAAS